MASQQAQRARSSLDNPKSQASLQRQKRLSLGASSVGEKSADGPLRFRHERLSMASPLNISIEDMVMPTSAQTPFGIKGYDPPKKSFPGDRVLGAPKWGKGKNTSFTESVIKMKEGLPSPDKYSTLSDWKDTIRGSQGRFLKSPRVLLGGQMPDPKNKTPGPGSYDASAPSKRFTGYSLSKDRKACAFIEDASFLSMEG